MLRGLYKLSMDGREIVSYEEIETENDLPEEGDGWDVYYFGDSTKEGVMKTGKAAVDIDGEDFTYNFRKSGSEGVIIYSGNERWDKNKDE